MWSPVLDESSLSQAINAKVAKVRRKGAQKDLASRALRFTLLVLIVVSFVTTTLAQTSDRGWEWQNPLPQGNSISAIRFADDKLHGWAVGADGVILYTADGGFQWARMVAFSGRASARVWLRA